MNRAELKEKAKVDLNKNYWRCILVSLVMMFVVSGTAAISLGNVIERYRNKEIVNEVVVHVNDTKTEEQKDFLVFVVLAAVLFITLSVGIGNIFMISPLEIGCKGFFLKNTDDKADLKEAFKGFRPYWRNVRTMLLKNLYIILAGMLLLVPGVMNYYSYSMVPYILAEDGSIKAREALKKSKAMTMGHRKELFILDLSFAGWVLSSFLLYLTPGIFYVYPYMYQTHAEVYQELKKGFENAEQRAAD